MLDVINKGPPTDGGYPADSDLHQMSDDGGPVGPDPARWSDPEWQDDPTEGDVPAVVDDLGELDTPDDPPPLPAPACSPWQVRRGKVALMERWRAVCSRVVGRRVAPAGV